MEKMYNWIVRRPETAAAIYEAVNAGTCTTPDHVAAIAAAYKDDIFWTGSLPTDNRVDDPLDESVADILRELGIPAHILGYRYVREAIILAARDTAMIHNMTKCLYPAIAVKFNSTNIRVERAIRHAIEIAWERGDVETLQRYFGYTVSPCKGKPTNGEFIAMVTEHVVRRALS